MRHPLRHVLGATRRNVLAVTGVVALLVTGHVLVPHWSTRYGAYLLAFAIWMAWFVATTVDVLGRTGE